jgi:hypothetical protein
VRQLIKKILKEETKVSNSIKRRANRQTLEKYITDGEINYPTLCDDFEDGYEYADAVIDYAIDKFLGEFDEYIDDEEDYYSDIMDYLRNACRDEFGQYLIDIYKMTCIEEDINESEITESPNERLEKLVGDYITMSYPTAKKIRIAPPGANVEITSFTLPNPEDEKDNFIIKFDAYGMPDYNINPDFLNSIKSMFGGNKNIKKIIFKWFDEKEVDNDLLSSNKEEQNESELTERCWKGYTQKGMKTMFGKKYPNCVKITKKKKRMNESKMLDYLKQFLSGEVLDNYKKEKGRKEFQRMVDMVYKITAKDNPIEGMVGVLVGNIDKSMWGQSFNDPNSVGARWDFTVILKPLFTNYNPNNESDYGERVLNFEKEFNENARGMGFELISPIQHEKVKSYRVKFEWASRLDVKEI